MTDDVGPKLSDSGNCIKLDDATVELVPAWFLDVMSYEKV